MLLSSSLRKLLAGTDGVAHALTGVAPGAGSGNGKLYIYAGTDPNDADAALNTSTTHTLLGMVTADAGVGTNGLSFAAWVAGVLAKTSSETWSTGNMTFTGFQSASSTLTATFARFCSGSNSPTAADSGTGNPRMHMTVRQAGQAPGDINLSSSTLNAGSNFVLDNFQLTN